MRTNSTAVILAGGIGSRLWPLSREQHPKQFISIDGHNTLLSNTLDRLPVLGIEKVIVICNYTHRFLVAETLRKHNFLDKNIILEPCGRNTAAAIALAALHVVQTRGEDENILVLAADHVINDCYKFTRSFENGLVSAENNKLVTFGIIPSYPETGYGYIEVGDEIDNNTFNIAQFVEKPNFDLAQKYISTKKFLWNSGMFIFKSKIYLQELKKFRPDILSSSILSYNNAVNDEDFIRISEGDFKHCPSESIDYAIMEKSSERVVVPLDAEWSDVGSWDSIWDLSAKDIKGNSLQGDILALETSNCYIRSGNRLIATYGIDDLIVVDTDDALLITPRNKSQFVKEIVEKLKVSKRRECENSSKEFRYWGEFQKINSSDDYNINILTLKPHKEISYQVHKHRIECWYILKGKALITINDEISQYDTADSILIKPGFKHKIKNNGSEDLFVIEIQHGYITDDNDTTRFK